MNGLNELRALSIISILFGGFVTPAFALLEECPEVTSASPKKIAIFTDGTGNTKGDQTNVRRLYEMVANQPGRNDIVTYYDRGVGNFGAKVFGGAVGIGLSRNVRQAYRCLADHYLPGDQVYLFGFSRGAYTARVLSGLVRVMGVVGFSEGLSKSEKKNLVEKIYNIYKDNKKEKFAMKRDKFQSAHTTHNVPIEVVGVWDTVSALGLTVAEDKLHEACVDSRTLAFFGRWFGSEEQECLLERTSERLYKEYHQVGPEGVKKILHAVSIDEKRHAFEIKLYDKADLIPGQILKQIWFAGVHSDVGGGYKDSDGLPSLALNWMIQNLREDGLLLGDVTVQGW